MPDVPKTPALLPITASRVPQGSSSDQGMASVVLMTMGVGMLLVFCFLASAFLYLKRALLAPASATSFRQCCTGIRERASDADRQRVVNHDAGSAALARLLSLFFTSSACVGLRFLALMTCPKGNP